MSDQILGAIGRQAAERLLVDWANLLDKPEASDRLLRRYLVVFAPVVSEVHYGATRLNAYEVIRLRNHLRKAWDAVDRRTRDWHIFQLRSLFNQWSRAYEAAEDITKKSVDWFEEPPHITPLEATMFYFQTGLANKAKHCGGTTCPAPYFIAKKKGQKHCSAKCSADATRQAKREWWHRSQNGGSL
jgi:hypothetical protein